MNRSFLNFNDLSYLGRAAMVCLALLGFAMLNNCAGAQNSQPAAATDVPVAAEDTTAAPVAAEPDSQNADPADSLDEPLKKLLAKVDAAGEKYRDIQASLIYTEEEVIFGERSVYTGKVYYSKDENDSKPAKFRIHLDKLRAGGKTSEEDRDYVFSTDSNGQWFTTRNAKIKQIIKYHIAPAGQQSDPLALGKGPFPVPFGQDSRQVLKMFTLSMRDPTATEPANTTCVKLLPKGDTAERLSVKDIEMWINPDGLPVRIKIDDLAGEVRKIAEFRRIETDSKISSETFDLPWPGALSGWERRIEPLAKPEK